MVELMAGKLDGALWAGKRVLLTGHTGFKGSWMALLLERLGAKVTGIALAPDTTPNLFGLLAPWKALDSHLIDLRDKEKLAACVQQAAPEIVIHMAAQPLVRRSYAEPVATMETNVMGTVYLLDALRQVADLKTALVVTSDKVYDNREQGVAFAEDAALGGADPYSASKAAAELLTRSYAASFFDASGVTVACARAGNVIGGGDWAEDRLIPDLWRAYVSGSKVTLRYPEAVRPWQHVIEPVVGYLLYVQYLAQQKTDAPRAMNFGPTADAVRTVRQVAEQFSSIMQADVWQAGKADGVMKESKHLAIDPSLAQRTLGWESHLTMDDAIAWTMAWYKAYHQKADMRAFSLQQLETYLQQAGC